MAERKPPPRRRPDDKTNEELGDIVDRAAANRPDLGPLAPDRERSGGGRTPPARRKEPG